MLLSGVNDCMVEHLGVWQNSYQWRVALLQLWTVFRLTLSGFYQTIWCSIDSGASTLLPCPNFDMISSLLDWASGTFVKRWAERYCSLRRQRLKYEYIYCCCEPLVHFRSTRLINSSQIDPDKTLQFEKKSDWNWSLYCLVFYLC